MCLTARAKDCGRQARCDPDPLHGSISKSLRRGCTQNWQAQNTSFVTHSKRWGTTAQRTLSDPKLPHKPGQEVDVVKKVGQNPWKGSMCARRQVSV